MKLLTWNCNGALRKKYTQLENFNADILVIQECENPKESTKQYQEWAKEYLWIGTNKNRGLGVFSKTKKIELLDWSDKYHLWKDEMLELFIPCLIDDKYILIAVWTKQANSKNFGYIGQLWKYLQLHKSKLKKESTIIIGDFNSNSIWDEWDRWWNHSDVVKELAALNIQSIYHKAYQEEQGKESVPTFFQHRKVDKKYHIDYIFSSSNLIQNSKSLEVGKPNVWLEYSDHMPITYLMQEKDSLC